MLKKVIPIIISVSLGTLQLFSNDKPSSHKNHIQFVIFVASYNNENYVIDNLKSICFQSSTVPYQVICVNDCSTDKTAKIMENFVRDNSLESKVTIIHNPERRGMLANIYKVAHSLPDHTIIVNVDGDDMLAHSNVLLRLEEVYADENIWLTYGSALQIPANEKLPSKEFPSKAFATYTLRSYPFYCQHLRTFKAGLFKKIVREDLKYNGDFMFSAGDCAYMFPMLEMAGHNHCKYISDVLYFYRVDNPINDFRIRREEQKKIDRYIRAKKIYRQLDSFE